MGHIDGGYTDADAEMIVPGITGIPRLEGLIERGRFEMDEAVEERVARMEGILDQMDKRLGRVEAELKELREETRVEIRGMREEMRNEINGLREEVREGFRRIDDRFQRMDDRFQRMDDRFYSFMKWIIAALIGSWATLMAAIIASTLK